PGQAWQTYASGSGRVQVTSQNGPASGAYHLTLDTSLSTTPQYEWGYPLLDEAVLHVNLLGNTNVALAFKEKEFNDGIFTDTPMPATFTGRGNYDGIALSVDGVHWYKLASP